ncbi:hypothetical protein RRG08_012656 [Elysia crispata]|uniref:Uncharacterized protein n=1 Tax=Elysia crispata TaxID=231223 RepID=A0AAE0YMW1_9GAST|nr:hypothetical protein RRG08_012656 [Elysia crispata]
MMVLSTVSSPPRPLPTGDYRQQFVTELSQASFTRSPISRTDISSRVPYVSHSWAPGWERLRPLKSRLLIPGNGLANLGDVRINLF